MSCEGNMSCEGPSDEGCKATNAKGECGGATNVAEQRMSATFSRLSERLIAQRLLRRIDHDVIDRRAIDPKDKKRSKPKSAPILKI